MIRFIVAIAFAIAVGSPRQAAAIPRSDCPKGTAWDIAAGACVKKKVAPRASAQERFEKASDDIEGRGKAPDPKRGLAALEQTCGEKHGPSCRLLGFLYVRGRPPATKDDRKAADYFAKGCTVNDLESCVDVGDLAVRTGDYAKARMAFQHGCDLGSGVACVRDGDLIDRGLGGAKDTATAQLLFKKGLDKLTPQCPATGFSDGLSCAWLGWLYEHGKGVARDNGKAMVAFRSGCNAGHGEACMSHGRALDTAKDTDGANKAYDRACTDFDNADACQKIGERLGMAKQDLPRAFTLAERGCQLDPKYCGTLAEFYRLGFGISAKDQTKATANYKKACDNGGLGWCENYGERVAEGNGATKDRNAAIVALEKACLGRYTSSCGPAARFLIDKEEYPRAQRLAKLGCDDDNGDSCYRLGFLRRNGKGVDKSEQNAVELFEKACKLDSPIGCNGYAEMLYDGTGVEKNPAKALEHFIKSCEGNKNVLFTDACVRWGKMTMTGDGVPKDLKSALKAYLRACEYKVADSCRFVPGINNEIGGKKEDIAKQLDTVCQTPFEEACHAYADLHTVSSSESDRRIAYETFEKSCNRKSEVGCIRQADLLAAGRGVTKNVEKAEQLFKQTCEAGYLYSCTGLGSLYMNAKKGEEAVVYYKRACEGGHADACSGIGFMYYTSNGVRWDITQAVGFFIKSCELGSLVGCANVGEMYRYGIGTKQDHKKAFESYTKSCNPPNIESGCSGAGHYLLTGEGGIAKDLKRAEVTLRLSCEAEYSNPSACQELAQLVELNKGSLSDVARLRNKAFTRATELAKDNPSYTWLLGEYYRDGMATPKDPVKATELFVKGCEGFDPMSCIAAGKALKENRKPGDADRARVYLERACAAGLAEGCAGLEAKGPTKTAGGKGCCGGEVAPGAEAGAIILLFVLVGRRRARRSRRRDRSTV